MRTALDRLGSDRPVVIGGMALVLVALALVAVVVRPTLIGGEDMRTVKADFADVQQLHEGDTVRIDGVEAGEVEAIRLDRDGRGATVSMKVKRSAGPVYRDAAAGVRWKLLLGANFYVDLERGSPQAGDLGESIIPRARTSKQVELEDITDATRGDAQQGLRELPDELARALRDPAAPGDALAALADAGPALSHGLPPLRGAGQRRDLRSVVKEAAALVRTLDTRGDELRTLVGGLGATMETTAARQADLRRTLADAPAITRRADTTLVQLDRTLALADPVIRGLRGPAPQVAPTLRALRPTLQGANRLARRAVPLLRSLRPAISSLGAAAADGVPLLDELDPSLVRLDETILPYLGEKDPVTKLSASQLIGPTVGGLGAGAAGQQDQNGHFIRFPATAGSSPAYLPCQTYVGNPDKAEELVTCQTLQEALQTLLTYEPIPSGKRGDR
jgi:phospholipid/cholesterol/gamma-HCH transport system substrate-binding protein